MSINRKFGKVLKALRSKTGLTQERLAELSKIDYKYIQNLEGKTPSSPTLNTFEKISKGLNIPISDIAKAIEDLDDNLDDL